MGATACCLHQVPSGPVGQVALVQCGPRRLPHGWVVGLPDTKARLDLPPASLPRCRGYRSLAAVAVVAAAVAAVAAAVAVVVVVVVVVVGVAAQLQWSGSSAMVATCRMGSNSRRMSGCASISSWSNK